MKSIRNLTTIDRLPRTTDLEVNGLKANVAVMAEVASLVKLTVGADVSLERVKLTITGVDAKALLEVRLDEVRAILDKALTALIENPEILEILAKSLIDVVREIGDVVGPVVDGVVGGVLRPLVDGVVGPVVDGVVDGVLRGVVVPAVGGAATQLTLGVDETVNKAGQTAQSVVDGPASVVERSVAPSRRSNRRHVHSS